MGHWPNIYSTKPNIYINKPAKIKNQSRATNLLI